MVAWPARVVAKAYGHAGHAIRQPVSANPEGAGHLSAGISGDRLARTFGYALRQSPLPRRKPAPAELFPFNDEPLY